MFERLLGLLQSSRREAPLPEVDALHLTGALLVRVARADDRWHLGEVQAVDRILTGLSGAGPVDAARLRAACERLETALPETALLGPLLLATLSMAERHALVARLHLVAGADGVEHPAERAIIDDVVALLAQQPEQFG